MSTPTELLKPLTDPSATPDTITTAVRGFNAQASASASSIGDFLWDAFSAFFQAVGRTPPSHQTNLLEFLTQLRHTTATDAEGKPLTYEDGEVWRDLPSFGWIARDVWNFDATDPNSTPEDRSQRENWTAFLAQLTARSNKENDPFDFSLFGLWTMRDAFEEERDKHPQAAVRLAALWVRFAGEKLRELSADRHRLGGNMGACGSKYGDCGWKGFDEDRWRAWRDELKEVSGKMEGDGLVKAAVETMEEL